MDGRGCCRTASTHRRTSSGGSPRSATWPTRDWPPPRTWRCGCTGRCSCEGEAGVGKTALAKALADVLGAPLIRLQCYEGIDAVPGALRLGLPAPAAAPARRRGGRRRPTPDAARGASSTTARFLVARPLLQALETHAVACCWSTRSTGPTTSSRRSCSRCCRDFTITVPELGTIRAERAARWSCSPPTAPARCTTRSSAAASTTGSSTRSFEREVAIVRRRLPEASSSRLARRSPRAAHALRDAGPAQAARRRRDARLGRGAARARRAGARPGLAAATLGAVLKYREDVERVRVPGRRRAGRAGAMAGRDAGPPAAGGAAATRSARCWSGSPGRCESAGVPVGPDRVAEAVRARGHLDPSRVPTSTGPAG